MKCLFLSLRRRFSIALILSSGFQLVFAFGELSTTDSRSVSLGGLQALSRELINPAYLSLHTKAQIGISVYNRFQMSELNTVGIHGILPNSLMDVGIKLSSYGYEEYRQTHLQTGLAKKINSRTSIGAKLVYVNESSLWEEKNRSYLAAGIGLFMHVNERINLALLADNLINNFTYRVLSLHAGADFQAFRNCLFLFEVSSNGNDYFNISIGFEYQLAARLFVRGGIRTNPKTPSLGVSYWWRELTFDVGFLLHQTLGSCSSIGLTYHF